MLQWLASLADFELVDARPASADASFRRYFRVTDRRDQSHYIVMDAPPDKEDCAPFIHITALLRGAGVHAPEIIEQSPEQGLLLLTDLGDHPYLGELDDANADALYGDALSALQRMQSIENGLPDYDAGRLREEIALFETWYLNRHLGIELTAAQQQSLQALFALLIDNALEQPQVFVHRDYHSRNLMHVNQNNPGVIDYQDAVIGPLTYDLVSLFKDCYIEWPRERVENWLRQYLEACALDVPWPRFLRWFDLMGLQRHLKVLGIFARLNYRDGKAQYLDDLPLTLKYVVDCARSYSELQDLLQLLEQQVLQHQRVRLA